MPPGSGRACRPLGLVKVQRHLERHGVIEIRPACSAERERKSIRRGGSSFRPGCDQSVMRHSPLAEWAGYWWNPSRWFARPAPSAHLLHRSVICRGKSRNTVQSRNFCHVVLRSGSPTPPPGLYPGLRDTSARPDPAAASPAPARLRLQTIVAGWSGPPWVHRAGKSAQASPGFPGPAAVAYRLSPVGCGTAWRELEFDRSRASSRNDAIPFHGRTRYCVPSWSMTVAPEMLVILPG